MLKKITLAALTMIGLGVFANDANAYYPRYGVYSARPGAYYYGAHYQYGPTRGYAYNYAGYGPYYNYGYRYYNYTPYVYPTYPVYPSYGYGYYGPRAGFSYYSPGIGIRIGY